VGSLVSLAVLWAWSDHRTLTGAFQQSAHLARALFGQIAVTSYQGLLGALRSYAEVLMPWLWQRLHHLMEQVAGGYWRVGLWLPLAVDGSRITTPRTRDNERAFAAPRYGRGKKARSRRKWKNKKKRSKKLSEPVKPQIWLTLLWHMGLKLPWSWKIGPSTASERHHLADAVQTQKFPENTMFCGDAGFVGFELWSTLREQGHHLLMRVGGNLRLLRNLVKTRHHYDHVYLWTKAALQAQRPPLELRLLTLQGPRGLVWVVTSVLSETELSDEQIRQLYRMRWGVELQFRALKQTFGRGKLRSRTPEAAIVELEWSLVGLWLIQLFAVKEQIILKSPPADSSVALAMNIIQEAMKHHHIAIATHLEMSHSLGKAIRDNYQRHTSKRAHYRPNKKDIPSTTKPLVRQANNDQRRAFAKLMLAA
jgi:hypothetical protein